jgi:hypothetical protein
MSPGRGVVAGILQFGQNCVAQANVILSTLCVVDDLPCDCLRTGRWTGAEAQTYYDVIIHCCERRDGLWVEPSILEPPFAVTQAAVLAIFILITLIAVIKFQPPKAQM